MNKLPEVKRFVKEKGHADQYPDLNIKFKGGAPPEFICYNGEEEVERVKLEKMKTDEIHELVQSKNLRREEL